MRLTDEELSLVKEKLFQARTLHSQLSVLQAKHQLAHAEYVQQVELMRVKYGISPSRDLSIDDGEWRTAKEK